MIRSLRQKHKLIWIAFAVLLPAIIVAGFVFRHREPVNDSVPPRVQTEKTTIK